MAGCLKNLEHMQVSQEGFMIIIILIDGRSENMFSSHLYCSGFSSPLQLTVFTLKCKIISDDQVHCINTNFSTQGLK